MELPILLIITIFIITYRMNTGDNVYKFFSSKVSEIYNKYAPYSYKTVKERTKELGLEYTSKQYVAQCTIFGIFAAVVSYLYFFSIVWALLYALVA